MKPFVWLPADERLLGDPPAQQPFLVLGDKYARAVKVGAGAQPVVFALADAGDVPQLLRGVDGVLLTGSPSNVHPSHYGQPVADPALPHDPQRDTLTLALVQACIAQAVPLLGVCRGFQEMNVALGGTLYQKVHEQPGLMDHREDKHATLAGQYAPAHAVTFAPGSVFRQWARADAAQVNSLHGQGIARLAPGLVAEAHAPDGLVEAFRVKDARAFAYGVQWHPEWRCWENEFYGAIFRAFGEACQMRQRARQLSTETRPTIAA